LGAEEVIVAVNIGTEATNVSFEVADLQSQPDQMLYGSASAEWSIEGESNYLSLNLPPRSGCILGSAH
jgi:hypothetical protein